jgi:flagellar hook-length control protein FliK
LGTTSKKAVGAAGSTDPTAALLGSAANAAPQANAPDGSVASTANPGDVAEQHQLDLAKDSQWLDSLTREITQAAGHAKELKFQLNPEHLGTLRVELSNHANGTSVRLIATSESARTILADAQPRLVAEARAQGLRISEAHIDLGGGSGGSGQRQPGPETMIVRTQAAPAAAVDTSVPGVSGERYA